MKNEIAGIEKAEFVGLRAKLYSCKMEYNNICNKCGDKEKLSKTCFDYIMINQKRTRE